MQKGWYTIPNQRSVGELMAATRERKAEAKEAVFEPDGTQVVEALRSLIRREMGKPTENEHPSLKEGMWLLLFCVNLVLLVSRRPRELLSDPTVELAGRLLPALLGSLFVIYLAWFRKRLLALSRHKRFNQLQVALLFVLALIDLPLSRISPNIRPKGTALSIDGKLHKNVQRVWLSCDVHDVILNPPKNSEAKERPFRFPVRSLLSAAWSGGNGPEWSLLYPVDFEVRDTLSKVQVRKKDGELYDDVFEGTDLERLDKSVFTLAMNGNDGKTIQLPLGGYGLHWLLGSGKPGPGCTAEVAESARTIASLEDKPCGR